MPKKIQLFSTDMTMFLFRQQKKRWLDDLKRLCLAEPADPSRKQAARLMVTQDTAGKTLKRKNERAIR